MERPAALISVRQGIASSTKKEEVPYSTSYQPFPSPHADPLSALSRSRGRETDTELCLSAFSSHCFPSSQAFNQVACLQSELFLHAAAQLVTHHSLSLHWKILLTLSLIERCLILLPNLTLLDCLSKRLILCDNSDQHKKALPTSPPRHILCNTRHTSNSASRPPTHIFIALDAHLGPGADPSRQHPLQQPPSTLQSVLYLCPSEAFGTHSFVPLSHKKDKSYVGQ
mgnify:FL=1